MEEMLVGAGEVGYFVSRASSALQDTNQMWGWVLLKTQGRPQLNQVYELLGLECVSSFPMLELFGAICFRGRLSQAGWIEETVHRLLNLSFNKRFVPLLVSITWRRSMIQSEIHEVAVDMSHPL